MIVPNVVENMLRLRSVCMEKSLTVALIVGESVLRHGLKTNFDSRTAIFVIWDVKN